MGGGPRAGVLFIFIVFSVALICSATAKDSDEDEKPADPDAGDSTLSERTFGLLPNPFEKRGLKFSATYIGEALANPAGGVRQGAVYEGRLNLAVDVDFAKAAQWKGLSFHGNVFQIHGNGLSRDDVGNLLTVSGIEALPTTRLYELWLEQKFANDRIAVRAGQLAADTEFINSSYASVFINSSFGWPAIMAVNLPAGGPAPPMAALGARVRAKLTDQVTILGAVFDGDSAGPGVGDPQLRNRYGLNFRLNDPPFMIGEVQYSYGGKEKGTLPGVLKAGAWYHAGSFNDQRMTQTGMSLADPNDSGVAAQRQGNHGIYGVYEQSLYQFGESKDRDIGVFARISGSPGDRNLVDLYADGGLTFNGPFERRPNDKFGIGVAYARISPRARELDHDFEVFTGVQRTIRDAETVFAATYWAEVRNGWIIHPSIQYVKHPNGGALDPADATGGSPLKDAVVLALRSIIKF